MTQVLDAEAIAANAGAVNTVPPGGDPASKSYIQGVQQAVVPQAPPVQLPPQPAPQPAPVQSNATLSMTPPKTAETDATSAVLTALLEKVNVLSSAHEATTAQTARQGVFNAVSGTTAGTEADFNNFVKWAQTNVDPASLSALNTVLSSGDPAVQAAMVAGYATQYRAATEDPAAGMLQGNTNIVPQQDATQGYLSEADFRGIMRSEKYKTEPQFAKAQDELRKRSIAMEQQHARGF